MDLNKTREIIDNFFCKAYVNDSFDYEEVQALKDCSALISSIQSAELPRKRIAQDKEDDGYNQCHDEFMPYVAKQDLRIKELEKLNNNGLEYVEELEHRIEGLQDDRARQLAEKDKQLALYEKETKAIEKLEDDDCALDCKDMAEKDREIANLQAKYDRSVDCHRADTQDEYIKQLEGKLSRIESIGVGEIADVIGFHIEAIGATYGKDSLEPIIEVIGGQIKDLIQERLR